MSDSESYVEANGVRLWTRYYGGDDINSPTCIIPTPGWGISAHQYEKTLTPLNRQFNIIFMETRGTNRSSAPSSSDDYSYETHCKDIDAVRKHYDLRSVWLCGHSLGGVLAMQYALDFSKNLDGLILLDTYAKTDQQYFDEVEANVMKRREEPWFANVYKEYLNEANVSSDDEFRRNIIETLPLYFSPKADLSKIESLFSDAETTFAPYSGWLAATGGEVTLLDNIHEISVPTILTVGSEDFICPPSQAEKIHLAIDNSKLLYFGGAGHFPWIEYTETFFLRVFRAIDALRT